MMVDVGLDADTFWSNTFRHNNFLAEHNRKKTEEAWMQIRNIEFSNYNTAFYGMSGKQIFKGIKKPQDLYTLPSEEIKKKKSTAVYDPERALAAYNKTEKDETKWLTKS